MMRWLLGIGGGMVTSEMMVDGEMRYEIVDDEMVTWDRRRDGDK